MKNRIVLLILSSLGTAFFLAFTIERPGRPGENQTQPVTASESIILKCGTDWKRLKPLLEEMEIPLISGSGSHKWKITTKSDSAQLYFNQGINMYYSFHIIEAMASFKKAAKFDPNSAMIQWAQALAYGPNINDLGYAASPDALATSGKATELSTNCTAKEKMLIAAQRARYSEDTTVSRQALNQVYADQMKTIYQKYPNDADVAALYADALMLQHPWDLWNVDGTPRPWTPEIRTVLEKLLVRSPYHPGANHYYIHVMEPSPFVAKALPSADRLGKITPALSHTVHMPSHIYLRTGQYEKGSLVNENAVNSYKKIASRYAPAMGADFLYVIHNLHMQVNNSMMAGREAYSVNSAGETANSISRDYLFSPGPFGNYTQYIYMTPMLVDIRFSRWDKIMNSQKPDDALVYANILYHFGISMAQASQGKTEDAKLSLKKMTELMNEPGLAVPMSPFSAVLEGAKVAKNILEGTMALYNEDFPEAIMKFGIAVSIEDNMVYNEPRDWMLNPRHFLGKALLRAGEYKDAEQVFRKDLGYNNENGWSLYGLHAALVAQGKTAQAQKILSRFKKAFRQSDIKMESLGG